jgi:CubicO group peptidase (beta-lactamase class C family)
MTTRNLLHGGRVIPALAAACALVALAASPLPGADETAAKVDRLFAAWDRTTSPGAALAVVKDGRIVYERGYGMAKLEDGIVNGPDTVFDIGSVSKQFTAACVALLVRDGQVRVEDDIRKYLPEMPDYGKPVTVGHLLHHTSGLRDYNALLELAGFRPDADAPTVEEAFEIIRRQKKLNYGPGDEYSYTNSGFFLLGQIVERVSGQSLNAFAQERIFGPLGMTRTLFQEDHTQIVKGRATGYAAAEGGGFKICLSNWDETGDGNVYTTVRDLVLWDRALSSGALGQGLTDMMLRTGALNSGQAIDYAWGLVVSRYKGLKVVEHGGAWVGFRAALVRFPDERFSVIILANLDAIDPSGLAFRIADIYLADKLKDAGQAAAADGAKPDPAAPKAEPYEAPKAELEALTGNWEDVRFGQWLTVSLKDGRPTAALGGRVFRLKPVGPGRFVAAERGDVELEFKAAEKGRAATARMAVGQALKFDFVKAPALKPLDAAALAAFAGAYESAELLDARYVIGIDKGELMLKTRTVPRAELKPMAPDKFTVPGFGLNIEFVRAGGRVTGFTVSVGRAAGIVFARAAR